MAQLLIENLSHPPISFEKMGMTLLELVAAEGIDWMHACGAKGRCTTCMVQVREGMENLGVLTEAEIRYREMGKLPRQARLACQAVVMGDLRVRVPKALQLPHLTYTD